MDYPVDGIHHITVCAGGAQEDIDFMINVAGQRLIKQTVLFDGRYAHYHMYYANAAAQPGSVYTTFPYNRVKGRPGSGQLAHTSYSIPKGSIAFWKDHLKANNANPGPVRERFGQKYMQFQHPSGLGLEVMEAEDARVGFEVGNITKDVSMQGFNSGLLSVREIAETERFFVDALGFRKTGQDGNIHRYEVAKGGAGAMVELVHEPEKASGSWTFGAGCAHHIAMNVADDEALAKQKGIYEELGYTDCSEIKDRNYFHSIYTRCPGGILVECAATAPGAFAKDEPYQEMGTSLLLPPWFEAQRKEIEAMLEPVTVPKANFANPLIEFVAAAAPGAAVSTAEASRRISGEWVPVTDK
jgi:glyoxalase family protein